MQPSTLVITPSGAVDLLARLHREFLVDPLDLGVSRVVLAGELTSPGVELRIAADFGAEVATVVLDPWSGAPVAHVAAGRLVAGEHVAVVELDRDADATPVAGGRYELAVRPSWSSPLAGATLRTGYVVEGRADGTVTAPSGTVGDRLLIRGQWVSVRQFQSALRLIDGIESWTIDVAREGTVDVATLKVRFSRTSLDENPVWRGRLIEAVEGLTPVDVGVAVVDGPLPDVVTDRRGHHLGVDRGQVDASSSDTRRSP